MMDMWNEFFSSQVRSLLRSITHTIDNSGQDILPQRDEVLEIFCRISPKNVKVIIIAQGPYPSAMDACGIPFVSKSRRVPTSLENIKYEIERQYKTCIGNPNEMILSWIHDEGVFLLNNSPTLGINLPSHHIYLRDHSVVWREFMSYLLPFLTKDPDIPIILMGNVAWELETFIRSKCILKVPHPVSRGDKSFIGCGVFENVNNYLRSLGKAEIVWS